jgi:hypothetical protein
VEERECQRDSKASPLGSHPPEGGELESQPLWPGPLPGAFHRNRIRRLRSMLDEARLIPEPSVKEEVNRQYDALERVLQDCFAQAATGKGVERHTDGGEDFSAQFICQGQRLVGVGFGLGQALKKTLEANRMAGRGENTRAIHELRGAVNYLAAAIIVLEERDERADPAR